MVNKDRQSSLSEKRKSGREILQQPVGGMPSGYGPFLENLKARIQAARVRAALSVNSKLIQLYYDIGHAIMEKQRTEGWGNKTIDRLSIDLRNAFPDMKGFSPRNLLYMKQFAEIYAGHPISQQPVAKLPWGHNVVLIDKLESIAQRLWYARAAYENGWSRNVLYPD